MGGSSKTQMWVDVYEAARLDKSLSGRLEMTDLPRIAELREIPTSSQAEILGEDARQVPISWAADFHQIMSSAAPPQSWLKLSVQAQILQKCVRCLEPVLVTSTQIRQFVFVSTEERAMQLDDELEDVDVLVGSKQFDLKVLIEDELIMALPTLPEHESCDLPFQAVQRQLLEQTTSRPFELLKEINWATNPQKKH